MIFNKIYYLHSNNLSFAQYNCFVLCIVYTSAPYILSKCYYSFQNNKSKKKTSIEVFFCSVYTVLKSDKYGCTRVIHDSVYEWAIQSYRLGLK